MLRRTVGLAAGIGVSSWLLSRRNVARTRNDHVQVPVSAPTADVKVEIYRLRGETVSIGGMVEWIIATIAGRFAQSKKKNPKAQWNDLKRHITSIGLRKHLQAELGSVNDYFKPRNLAAHAGILITGVAGTTQIFRFYRDKADLRVDLVTLESMQEEVAIARAGYEAIRAIGRTLDDRQPEALADMNDLTKAMLLGRT